MHAGNFFLTMSLFSSLQLFFGERAKVGFLGVLIQKVDLPLPPLSLSLATTNLHWSPSCPRGYVIFCVIMRWINLAREAGPWNRFRLAYLKNWSSLGWPGRILNFYSIWHFITHKCISLESILQRRCLLLLKMLPWLYWLVSLFFWWVSFFWFIVVVSVIVPIFPAYHWE